MVQLVIQSRNNNLCCCHDDVLIIDMNTTINNDNKPILYNYIKKFLENRFKDLMVPKHMDLDNESLHGDYILFNDGNNRNSTVTRLTEFEFNKMLELDIGSDFHFGENIHISHHGDCYYDKQFRCIKRNDNEKVSLSAIFVNK